MTEEYEQAVADTMAIAQALRHMEESEACRIAVMLAHLAGEVINAHLNDEPIPDWQSWHAAPAMQ